MSSPIAIAKTKVEFLKLYPTTKSITDEMATNILDFFNDRAEWEGEFDAGTYNHLTDAPDCVWIFWTMYRIVDHPLWEDWAKEDHDADWDAINRRVKFLQRKRRNWDGSSAQLRKVVKQLNARR